MLGPAAIVVAAIAGVEGADEILRARADRGPKDFREFIGSLAVCALIALIAEARRRGRVGEGGGWAGESGLCDDEGGGCDDGGD